MAEIEFYSARSCTKCIFVDEESGKTRFWHRLFPDLSELVKHFGTKDGWAIAKAWPDNGVMFHECKKCKSVWVTHTSDEWTQFEEGD